MQGEFLSELKGKITDVVIIPVPEGTRVNARFNGTLRGPKVNGTAKGTDYVLFRADGSGILHIHAVITTEESDLIYIESSGFLTCMHAYAWLNTTPAVSEGYSDNESGEVHLKYFVPFANNESCSS